MEIKTTIRAGSNKEVVSQFYTAEGAPVGGVTLYFESTTKYQIWHCNKHKINLTPNLPSTVDKVWRISLSRSPDVRVVIHCNGKEVVDALVSESTCEDLSWSRAGSGSKT